MNTYSAKGGGFIELIFIILMKKFRDVKWDK